MPNEEFSAKFLDGLEVAIRHFIPADKRDTEIVRQHQRDTWVFYAGEVEIAYIQESSSVMWLRGKHFLVGKDLVVTNAGTSYPTRTTDAIPMRLTPTMMGLMLDTEFRKDLFARAE
ncbi:MAG: hypothetical protein JRN62_03810 [Nitrososphaerota archaeon]|nr:hypothetical protein [Nitrososphaerota archaeon]MDG6948728.1 hypothetical protein [Nitrososphaerota archaeon]